MSFCLSCINRHMVKRIGFLKKEKLLKSEIETNVLLCRRCKRRRPCVTEIERNARYKVDWGEYRKYKTLAILEWWDHPDFQEEKARMREEFFKSHPEFQFK